MPQNDSDHRLAVLLSVLQHDAADPALAALDADRAERIRQRLAEIQQQPPDSEEIEAVLDDFDKFFRFAVQTCNLPTASPIPITGKTSGADKDDRSASSKSTKSKTSLKLFDPSNDPIADLHRLAPSQIARALSSEHPKSIALVLSQLDKSLTAETLDLLPEDVQFKVFYQLKEEPNVSPDLIARIASHGRQRNADRAGIGRRARPRSANGRSAATATEEDPHANGHGTAAGRRGGRRPLARIAVCV